MAKKSMSYDDVLAKCAALCAKAEHSRVEMIGRMCRWGVSRELAQMVADRLEDGGFIDARRFAEAFVHDKSKFDFWGRIKIRYYLRMNGIKDDLIEEAVSRIDPEEYQEGLERLLSNKLATLNGKEPYQTKLALFRYAASRGYESSVVANVVNRMISDADELDVADDD